MTSPTLTLTLTAADGATETLTVPYPAIAESAAGTAITTVGPSLNASPTPGVAGSGNFIAITPDGEVSVNGVALPTANVVELYYTNHTAYQLNSAGNWYGPITASNPGSAVPSPLPGGGGGTVIFSDNFATENTSLWNWGDGGCSVSGNQLVCQTNNAYTGTITTNATDYDFTDCAFSVQVIQTPSPAANGTNECGIQVCASGAEFTTNGPYFTIEDNYFFGVMEANVSLNSYQPVELDHSSIPIQNGWWIRLRHSSATGLIYWEYASGVVGTNTYPTSWTTLYSTAVANVGGTNGPLGSTPFVVSEVGFCIDCGFWVAQSALIGPFIIANASLQKGVN